RPTSAIYSLSLHDALPIYPFRYGALALDDAFADREAELRELVADVRNGQDVVIFAPRRYGKSSLIWRAAARLHRAKVLVAAIDLDRKSTRLNSSHVKISYA